MSKPTSAKRRAAVRRRRTLLGLVLVVAAIAAAVLIWRPWAGADAPPPAAVPSESATAATSPSATTPAPTPTPTTPFTPIGGSPSAVTGEPCAPEAVRITPSTDRGSYPAGEPVLLSFTIENVGETPCSLNAGTTVQEYEIRTGDQLVYRWSDCAADVQDNIVELEPATPQSTVPIEWDRTASSIDTCTAERPQVAAGGTAYSLTVRVGEHASTESTRFTLE
ncbi:hypothetical protein [Agrococcus sp. HG114]|uniref:hypothetical protein n=1 Tax=Agrococcus sp. HG114 TaxID=2969757 RepID=UPI00215A8804|nr:hypothetical protein [Agrococcus sp. HG114]MCR8670953.1 hypothetical protein [Agrococcus sp. HG114]